MSPNSNHIWASKSRSQKNPVIPLIRKCGIDFTDFHTSRDFDFLLGSDRIGIFFLSLCYHCTNPQYLPQRIATLGPEAVRNSILLFWDDRGRDERVSSHVYEAALKDVQIGAFKFDMRMLLASSLEEAAKMMEILHVYTPARADEVARGVQGSMGFEEKAKDVLQNIKGVSSSDVVSLLNRFGNLKGIANATEQQLMTIHSIGEKKAKAIFKCFNDPL